MSASVKRSSLPGLGESQRRNVVPTKRNVVQRSKSNKKEEPKNNWRKDVFNPKPISNGNKLQRRGKHVGLMAVENGAKINEKAPSDVALNNFLKKIVTDKRFSNTASINKAVTERMRSKAASE